MILLKAHIHKRDDKQTMFHLSTENLDGKILVPKIPKNYFTENGYENSDIPRVCFSDTISNCIAALSTHRKEGCYFYVHEPISTNSKIMSNQLIVKNNYVSDAHITKECWILEPVKIKCIGKVRLLSAIDEYITFNYGEHSANLYFWNYEFEKF
jgi:hypothetical protein